VGEGDPRGETDTPEVGEQTIYVREQFAQPLASQKLLDMSGFDVEGWLGRKIGDKLGRVENTKFVSGTGVKEPRGFVDYGAAAVTTDDDGPRAWGVLQYVPTGAAAGFPTLSGGGDDPDALIDLQLKLKPEYLPGAVWAMRRSTAAVIRKLKDKDGRYIWLDNITEGGRPLLLGHPVTFLEDMPAVAANSFSVAFGNFNVGYQIVDGPAIRVLRDPFTTKGKVKFYTTKWTGGDVVNFDALKLLKFGTS
jgi:HK97 family phage major capsid protein